MINKICEIPNLLKYGINLDGEVYSKKQSKDWKKLKSYPDQDGYLVVGLCVDKKMGNRKIHRLLAQTFLSNPENKPLVRHIDGNLKNNKLENLAWATAKENAADRKTHGTENPPQGERQAFSKLNGKQVRVIKWLLRSTITKFSQRQIGEMFNVRGSGIGKISRGETWKHIII